MCQTVSIVSGNGLLPFQHQAISSVPEPCWLKINWTLMNNPVKFISPCYLIHLFITVHKIWIELNWNWKKMNWIGIELKDSESDLNWNWIELKNPESNLNWNWIELKEMNWSEPCLHVWWIKMKSLLGYHINKLIWQYLCPKWAWICGPIWPICYILRDNAMLKLSCKCSESKWNPYCRIVSTSSSGTNNVPNEHEDVDQYDSYAIPPEIMSC